MQNLGLFITPLPFFLLVWVTGFFFLLLWLVICDSLLDMKNHRGSRCSLSARGSVFSGQSRKLISLIHWGTMLIGGWGGVGYGFIYFWFAPTPRVYVAKDSSWKLEVFTRPPYSWRMLNSPLNSFLLFRGFLLSSLDPCRSFSFPT